MSLDTPSAAPLAKIYGPDGGLRWYNPLTRCSVPCDAVFDGLMAAHLDGKSLDEVSRDDDTAQAALAQLRAAGFFAAPPDDKAPTAPCDWTLTPAVPRFLNAPDAPNAKLGILGAPVAFGSADGIAQAPDYLRQLASSFLYQIDSRTGDPLGFYDTATQRNVLQGLSISDFGNFSSADAEGSGAVFSALRAAAKAAWQRCEMLVTLGGDHAITPALVAEAPAPKLQVVILDAHADTDHAPPGQHDKAAAAADLCALPHVDRVIQVGVRGYDDLRLKDREWDLGSVLQRIGATDADAICAELDARLDPDIPCYVSLDLDVLEPQLARGTQYLSPGGLSFGAFRQVLFHLGGLATPIGMDLVEILPAEDQRGLTGHAAIMGLLTLLDGWWTQHGE